MWMHESDVCVGVAEHVSSDLLGAVAAAPEILLPGEHLTAFIAMHTA